MSRPNPNTRNIVDLAAVQLASAGFTVEMAVGDSGSGLLLAENELFVVGIGSTSEVAKIEPLVDELALTLVDRVSDVDIGPKRWDVYLVVLCSGLPEEGERERITSITRNLHNFRRIVRVEVLATQASVSSALSMFLPFAKRELSDVTRDALSLLAEELPLHGVDQAEAMQVIESYRNTGEIRYDQ